MNDQLQTKAILWYLKVAGDALRHGDTKFAKTAAERATAALGCEVLPYVPAPVPASDPRQPGLPFLKATPKEEPPAPLAEELILVPIGQIVAKAIRAGAEEASPFETYEGPAFTPTTATSPETSAPLEIAASSEAEAKAEDLGAEPPQLPAWTEEQGEKLKALGKECGVKIYPWVCLTCGASFEFRGDWHEHCGIEHDLVPAGAQIVLDGATFWVSGAQTTAQELKAAFKLAELWADDGAEWVELTGDDPLRLGDADMEDSFLSAKPLPTPLTMGEHLALIRAKSTSGEVAEARATALAEYPDMHEAIEYEATARLRKLAAPLSKAAPHLAKLEACTTREEYTPLWNQLLSEFGGGSNEYMEVLRHYDSHWFALPSAPKEETAKPDPLEKGLADLAASKTDKACLAIFDKMIGKFHKNTEAKAKIQAARQAWLTTPRTEPTKPKRPAKAAKGVL